MAQHIEIEFKNLVTEDEFNQLSRHFGVNKHSFILQENHYFDTPAFDLKQSGRALRIRQKNGEYELTLKEPRKIGLLETNQIISEEQVQGLINTNIFPKGHIEERLISLEINIPLIHYFGTLKTWRAETNYLGGLLVFDKSEYLNKQDFEIEYEVPDYETGKETFRRLLDTFAIPKRQTDNKILRFYKQKQLKGI